MQADPAVMGLELRLHYLAPGHFSKHPVPLIERRFDVGK
jgi:hypothetical protein